MVTTVATATTPLYENMNFPPFILMLRILPRSLLSSQPALGKSFLAVAKRLYRLSNGDFNAFYDGREKGALCIQGLKGALE
jgi:hypothetical protein